jgi:hypothetical protein
MSSPDDVVAPNSGEETAAARDVVTNPDTQRPALTLEEAQLEKIRLEIEQLKETRTDWLGKALPWITASLALAAFIFQIYVNKTSMKYNFEREYWSRQLVQYEAAVDLASKLSTEDKSQRDADFKSFEELYYGKLVIYEDVPVHKAMANFRERYIDYIDNPGLQNDMQHAARALADECRQSAARTWGQEYVPISSEGHR